MLKLALLLFLQAAVPPQVEIVGPYTTREDEGQTTRVTLKNGLIVIVREEHAYPLAAITTHVKAGRFDEDDRVNGISRVIERVIFEGTAKRPTGASEGELKSLGGILDTHSSYESTVFRTAVPAANLLAALDIHGDAVFHPSLEEAAIRREIELLIQENNHRLDDAAFLASDKLYETAFIQHRMKRTTGGTAEGLRALTRDDMVAFHQKYYRPSNIILSIVAPMDREKVLEGVVRIYAAEENVPVERDPSPAEPPQDGLRYAWRRGPVQQAHVAMGFHVSEIQPGEARALEVLAAILSTGRASRLNQFLREGKGVITAGSAELHVHKDVGYFQIGLEAESPIEAAIGALAEIESIKRSGVTAESVGRARAAVAREFLTRLERVEQISSALAFYEALGDWKQSQTYLSEIQQLTPERIRAVARKYLTFANLTVFEYLPESIERYFSLEEYRAAVLDKVDAAVERRTEDELPVVAQIPQRTDGLVVDAVGTVQRRSILRGPDVYILEDHQLPLVSFGIFFPGGRLLETERNAGITELMLRSALRGAGKYDSAGIARRLENAGVRIRIVNEPDFFGYILDGLSGRMDQALGFLVDILQQPVFGEAEVDSERTLQLAEIRKQRDDNEEFPVKLFLGELFGEHPYAYSAVGTEAGIGKLTGNELREWFRNHQRKILPTVVIVGDTRGTALIAPLTDPLTNEDLEPRDLLAMPRLQPAIETGERTETIDRQLTTLVYGFPGVNRSSNDRYALDLLAGVVSGRGGLLHDAIRDTQGLAYTVQTSNLSHSRGGAVFTSAAFPPEKEADVRAALDAEYGKLRSDRISADELRRAIPYTIAAHDVGLQSRQARVLEYARAVYSGAGVQSVPRYEAAVRALTPDQVKAAVERYLNPAAVRLGIVRAAQ
jgi:zinc protease